MAGAVAGIELPEGDPGAVSDAARGLRGVAAGFAGTGQVTQRALGSVPSWEGAAAISFQSRCGDHADAAAAAQGACERGSAVLSRFAERLEDGRERVRRLQERAEDCLRRIAAADDRAAEAGDREASANLMAFQASFAPDAGASAAGLRDQADQAGAERRQAEHEAQRARDELERLRQKAHEEREAVKEAADAAASQVSSAVSGLPEVTWAGPFGGGSLLSPAQAQFIQIGRSQEVAGEGEDEEEDDDSALENAGDWLWNAGGDAAEFTKEQAVGFGTGVKEGVVGIGQGGAMLYRLSPTNALFNNDSFKQEWQNVGRAGEYAWHNPGEFGKAVVNWEDLSEGRYGEWLGNLAPDAVLAFGTAGAGTVASRGLRGADAVGDTADAARDLERVSEGTTVYRLHGYNEAPDGLRLQEGSTGPLGESRPSGSWPWGASWTDVNPFDLSDPRAELGLPTGPDGNPARFMSIGELRDVTGVERRDALPLDGNPGGAPELLIPDPQNQVELREIHGLNPEP